MKYRTVLRKSALYRTPKSPLVQYYLYSPWKILKEHDTRVEYKFISTSFYKSTLNLLCVLYYSRIRCKVVFINDTNFLKSPVILEVRQARVPPCASVLNYVNRILDHTKILCPLLSRHCRITLIVLWQAQKMINYGIWHYTCIIAKSMSINLSGSNLFLHFYYDKLRFISTLVFSFVLKKYLFSL